MGDKAKYTILSMMKDEGHCLLEWVAFHHHIGFDNICVYTNDCNDGTDEMLIRLEELGYCHHFPNVVPEGKKPQPNALTLALKNPKVMNSEWILTMDADEFVSIKCGRGWVSNLMENIPEDTDAIAITWRFFGSAEITDWNPGLVTEAYTRAAPDKFRKGWGVKTMFRPFENMKFGIHRPHMKRAKQDPKVAEVALQQKWVNGSGTPMHKNFPVSGWRSIGPSLGYKLVEMNHYGVKSYEAYLLRRIRGNVNNKVGKYDAAYFARFDRNEIEATNARRHAKAVKRLIATMLEDPKLRDLYEGAMEFHRARVEKLHETGEYQTWLDELKEAGETPIDKLDEILFTQHLPKKWQAEVKRLIDEGVPKKEIALMIARSTSIRTASDERANLVDSLKDDAKKTDDLLEAREAAAMGTPPATMAEAALQTNGTPPDVTAPPDQGRPRRRLRIRLADISPDKVPPAPKPAAASDAQKKDSQ